MRKHLPNPNPCIITKPTFVYIVRNTHPIHFHSWAYLHIELGNSVCEGGIGAEVIQPEFDCHSMGL